MPPLLLLSRYQASITGITYDDGADTLSVAVTAMGLPVTLTLTKSAKGLPKSLPKSTQHAEFTGAAAGTLKQKQCLDKKCSGTCRTYSVPSGFCLGTQTKGKFAKVSCGGGKVTTTVYTNADCTGSGTASSTAVDKCVADEVGRFFEWLPCGKGQRDNVLPQVRVSKYSSNIQCSENMYWYTKK